MICWFPHLNDACKIFPIEIIVSFKENFSQPAFTNGIVFSVELIKPMECVAILNENEKGLEQKNTKLINWTPHTRLMANQNTYCMYIKHIHSQIIGCQIHRLKHLFESHRSFVYSNNFISVIF